MRSQAGLRSAFGQRVVSLAGTVCVVASFALLSPGVRIARAGEGTPPPAAEAVADPAVGPAAEPDAAPKASPFVKAEDTEAARRPGVSGIEVSPGVIVLNTRGYNYGPPPTPIAPEAMRQEKAPR
ncbi:MAG: hypothetical protein U0900_11590 [Myxococcota bacterium]